MYVTVVLQYMVERIHQNYALQVMTGYNYRMLFLLLYVPCWFIAEQSTTPMFHRVTTPFLPIQWAILFNNNNIYIIIIIVIVISVQLMYNAPYGPTGKPIQQ